MDLGVDAYSASLKQAVFNEGVVPFSTHATQLFTRASFVRGDYLLFGPESCGLPVWLRDALPKLKLPQPGGGRSLNLSVAAGVAAFEAGRQIEGW